MKTYYSKKKAKRLAELIAEEADLMNRNHKKPSAKYARRIAEIRIESQSILDGRIKTKIKP